MKKNNKKGFTLVELVIVIAVIAILSAVLVPTFGNVIKNANDTARLEDARTAYQNFLIDYNEDDMISNKAYILVDVKPENDTTGNITAIGYAFEVNNGALTKVEKSDSDGSLLDAVKGKLGGANVAFGTTTDASGNKSALAEKKAYSLGKAGMYIVFVK